MIFWIWGSFSCGNISGSTQQAPRVAPVSGTLHTHLLVHGGHGLGHPLHGLGHAVVWLERLYLQTDRLNVGFHQDELLDVPAGADQIFSHDLNSVLHEWNSSRLILIINPFNAAKAGFFFLLTICPCLAIFFMSAMIFFSCCSSFTRSLSRSLMARLRSLWFSLNICSGVFLLPKMNSIYSKRRKLTSNRQLTDILWV